MPEAVQQCCSYCCKHPSQGKSSPTWIKKVLYTISLFFLNETKTKCPWLFHPIRFALSMLSTFFPKTFQPLAFCPQGQKDPLPKNSTYRAQLQHIYSTSKEHIGSIFAARAENLLFFQGSTYSARAADVLCDSK